MKTTIESVFVPQQQNTFKLYLVRLPVHAVEYLNKRLSTLIIARLSGNSKNSTLSLDELYSLNWHFDYHPEDQAEQNMVIDHPTLELLQLLLTEDLYDIVNQFDLNITARQGVSDLVAPMNWLRDFCSRLLQPLPVQERMVPVPIFTFSILLRRKNKG